MGSLFPNCEYRLFVKKIIIVIAVNLRIFFILLYVSPNYLKIIYNINLTFHPCPPLAGMTLHIHFRQA
jgi:hypothetical protein